MTTNDIVKIRKPQTRLKRTQFDLRLHRKDEDNFTRGFNSTTRCSAEGNCATKFNWREFLEVQERRQSTDCEFICDAIVN